MSKKDDNHTQALLEEIRSQNQAVIEAIGDMRDKVDLIPEMRADIKDLQVDMKVVKSAVKETNEDLKHLEHRVIRLETA
jgi:polyhydroxyalkanoate synthesis regulator phasin